MTALFIAQIGTFDFADYVRVGPSDGLDPYGKGWAEPQFADAAFDAGQPLTNVAVGNREMVWPLYLNVRTLYPGDELTPEEELLMEQHIHELVVDMNRALAQPNLQLQWCDAHAPAITYYDVAFARFDPEYNYRQDQFGWKAGTLRVWCNPPYGHTGTHRIVATSAGGSGAARIAMSTGLLGDVPAALQVSVRRGGAEPLAAPGRSIAVAAVPSGVVGLTPAASMTAGANATISSGAAQYVAGDGADQGGYVDVHLSPGTAYAGQRMRVLALAEPGDRSGVRLQALRDSVAIGAAQMATAVGGRSLLDLGAFEVPALDTRATQTVQLKMTQPVGSLLYAGASRGTLSSVYGLLVAPEDRLSVIRDAPGAALGFDDCIAATFAHVAGRYDSLGNGWVSPAEKGAGVGSAIGELTVGSYTQGRLDQRGFCPTSPEVSLRWRGAEWVHRDVGDLTLTLGVQPDATLSNVVHARKDITNSIAARATPRLYVSVDYQHYPQGATLAASGALSIHVFNGSGSILGTAAIPSAAPTAFQPGVLQMVQRGKNIEGRLYSAAGSCVAIATGSFSGIENPGHGMVAISGASGAHSVRILDTEALTVPSAVMSPTDTYVIGSAAYRSHPSHGFSGELPILGAAPEIPVDTAAVVVAIGGHEPGDAPSVNDVTIRAQERFNLAR